MAIFIQGAEGRHGSPGAVAAKPRASQATDDAGDSASGNAAACTSDCSARAQPTSEYFPGGRRVGHCIEAMSFSYWLSTYSGRRS